MSLKQSTEFKASQLYDWHSEPAEERSSSFFFDESTRAEPTRPRPDRTRNASSLSVAIVIVVMMGAIGLVAMARLLPD